MSASNPFDLTALMAAVNAAAAEDEAAGSSDDTSGGELTPFSIDDIEA